MRWVPRRRAWVVGIVMSAALAASCGSGDRDDPEGLVALVATRIDIGGAPWGVAIDGGTVWVSDASRAVVVALDAGTGEQQRAIPTGAADARDAGLAISDGELWIANLGGSVAVLDTASGDVVGRVAVAPGEPAAVALTERDAWAPRHGPGGGLTRIPRRDVAAASRTSLRSSAFAVATDDRTIWVTGLDEGLAAVDPGSGEVRFEVDLPGSPRGVALLEGDAWITLRDQRQVVRVDGRSGEIVARIEVEGEPWPIAAGAGAVWVAELEGRLLRIDPVAERVDAAVAIAPQPRAIAVGDDATWVTSQTGAVFRVESGS